MTPEFVLGSPLLILFTLLVGALCADGRNESERTFRDCPGSFNFLREAYSSCAHYRRNRGAHLQQQITGGDIIIRFQEICSSRPRMEKCRNLALEGCSQNHLETYQTAVDRSLWFCDDENNIRGAMTRALTGTTAAVPETERNRSHCVNESMLYSCVGHILGQSRFSRVKNYGNVIQHHAHQVLSDPVAHAYFKELFNCYFDIVHAKCPHNAIPMTVDSQDHLFLPPKFGINVSDIILNKFVEFQNK